MLKETHQYQGRIKQTHLFCRRHSLALFFGYSFTPRHFQTATSKVNIGGGALRLITLVMPWRRRDELTPENNWRKFWINVDKTESATRPILTFPSSRGCTINLQKSHLGVWGSTEASLKRRSRKERGRSAMTESEGGSTAGSNFSHRPPATNAERSCQKH